MAAAPANPISPFTSFSLSIDDRISNDAAGIPTLIAILRRTSEFILSSKLLNADPTGSRKLVIFSAMPPKPFLSTTDLIFEIKEIITPINAPPVRNFNPSPPEKFCLVLENNPEIVSFKLSIIGFILPVAALTFSPIPLKNAMNFSKCFSLSELIISVKLSSFSENLSNPLTEPS